MNSDLNTKCRDNGEGTIRQRKDGTFESRLRIGNGLRRSFYGKTRKEVRSKLNTARRDHEAGRLSLEPGRKVGDYLDEWLERDAKRRVLVTTYESYALQVERVKPYIGHLRMDSLHASHIDNCYEQLQQPRPGGRKALSAASVQRVHAVLRMALKRAFREGYLPANPMDLVAPPRPLHKEMQPLSLQQAQALFAHTRHDRLHALWVLLTTTGLRVGEAIAVSWGAVDLEARTLKIGASAHRQKGQGIVIGEPKTKQSRRTVDLSASAVSALRAHQTGQKEERLAAGASWNERNLVFCSAGGRPLDPGFLRQSLRRNLAAAALPFVRIHDLRHTAASFLFAEGVNLKSIQNALGHSTAKLTLDTYTHLTTDSRKEAALAMDRLFPVEDQAV